MVQTFTRFAIALIFMSLAAGPAWAQRQMKAGTCGGPIYGPNDVSSRAKIIAQPNFNVIYRTFGNDVHLRVILDAVLCQSGRVTDIKVIESSVTKITEFAVAAVAQMRFQPAEVNWQAVSQRQRFQFDLNSNNEEISQQAAANRMIEHVDIVGNRRITRNRIWSWIRTRPGEPYSYEQTNRDLKAILAKGYFNPEGTRLHTAEGDRGGVGVIFEVAELPRINEIKFQGLNRDALAVRRALIKELNLQRGAVSRPVALKAAPEVVTRVLRNRGKQTGKVDLLTESPSATTINLIFVLKNN